MSKFLTILWVIIFAGIAFIFSNLSENEFETEIPITRTIANLPEENSHNAQITEHEGTFNEYMDEGEKSFKKENYISAITNYSLATKLKPKSEEALRLLAESYLKENNPQKAKESFQKAEKLNPNSIEIKLGIFRSLLNNREIEAANNMLQTLDQANPKVRYYKGIMHVLYKNFDEAKKAFEEIQEDKNAQKFLEKFVTFSYYTEENILFLETLLAKALTEVKEYEAAIPLLYEILNEKDNYKDAWLVLGYAYLQTAKTADAIDAFSQAKSLNEDKPETLFFLGLAYQENKNTERAIFYLEKALENGYEPKEQIELKLAELYTEKGKYKEASKKYGNILAVNTSNIGIFEEIVWLNIEKLNKPGYAFEMAKLALESHPQNPISYNLIARSLIELNKFDDAKKYLNQAMEMEENLDQTHLNFAILYEKQGLTSFAKEYYKKAYSLGKGNDIGIIAAKKYNELNNKNTNKYFKANILSPNK